MSAATQNELAQHLSALVDGEVDGAAATAAACECWRSDAEARRTWHAYHLIGDVLRSEDLAASAGRDPGFLLTVRGRLALEPIVLAPAPLPGSVAKPRLGSAAAAGWRGSRWAVPAALAASFALVIGSYSLMLPVEAPSAHQPAVALADVAPPPGAEAAQQPATAQTQVVAANGKLMRDAQLDRYLAAHKQFSGSSALGVPSVFLRSATVDAEGR